MDWKIGLDRYLTQEPDDSFDSYCECVIDSHDDLFYELNEDWINEYDGQHNKWLNDLFKRDIPFKTATKLIERARAFSLKYNV